MDANRNIVVALLQLGALDKDDWDGALRQILRVDSSVLDVERVNYWTLDREPQALRCEVGYSATPRAYERGFVLTEAGHERYLEAIRGESVIAVDDVAVDPRAQDVADYLSLHEIGAILDVPVWSEGRLAGVLCHEHVGSSRTWSDTDVDFALAVAQVVTTTLESRRRCAVEAAHRRASLLARAAYLLAQSLDEQVIAVHATEVALPVLGEWAVLDAFVEGALRRLAYAHVSPEGRATVERLSEEYPPLTGGPHLSTRIAHVRESVLVPEVAPGVLERLGYSDGHRRLIEELGVISVIGVPLIVRDSVLGAMSFNSCNRSFDRTDLDLAEDLAHRVAASLENARLYRVANAAIRLRDVFLSLAAHELHSPLATLLLSAEALVREAESSKMERIVRLAGGVARSSKRLVRLVDRMLEASRINLDKFSIEPMRLELTGLVRDVVRGFDAALARAATEVNVHAPAPVWGRWDPTRLEQVVTNLLENALRFGQGPVDVTVERAGEEAKLEVRDHGPGIPPERLSHVFDAYERGVSSRAFGGLGLGLFIVRGVAEAHGGHVEVDNAPGGGARFVVHLPI